MNILTTLKQTCATIAVVLATGGAAMYVLLYWIPGFVVRNASVEPVTVHAHWRDQRRLIGTLAPAEEVEFSVGGAAAMRFEVRYASGRVTRSEEIQFSSGVKIIATISDTQVLLTYRD